MHRFLRTTRGLLATAAFGLWLATSLGCAAVAPQQHGCRCGECTASTVGGGDIVADLARTFDEMVVGASHESAVAAHDIADAIAEPEEIAPPPLDLHDPLSQLAEEEGLPMDQRTRHRAMPVDAAGNSVGDGSCQPASHYSAVPPAVAGPPPRFFPVPPRPVFSSSPTSCWLGH